MKKITLLLGVVAASLVTLADANTVSIQMTASTIVSNIPADFSTKQFALLRPWELDQAPAFSISEFPTTDTLNVNSLNNLPALEITDHTPPNNGLSWFFYCDNLTLNYQHAQNAATIQFSGTINTRSPGSGVVCQCSGPACSTTAPVAAKLMIR